MTSSGCIFVKFDVGAFFNVCDENWNLINIGQKYWALHMKASEHTVVDSDISLPQQHCIKTLNIFIMLEVTGIMQQ
jgi:hypothetical protein